MSELFEYIKKSGLNLKQVLLVFLLFVFLVFILLGLLKYGFVYWIYVTVEDWVTIRLGFDYYFATLIATIFTFSFALMIPTLAYYIFLGKRKAWGIGAVVGTQLLITVGVYTVGNTVCFNRRTGEPLCYVADTPQGKVWSYSPGFDPASGEKFRLYTINEKRSEKIK